MTQLERAVLQAIDDRVARHDAEVEVLIAAMRSSLNDLLSAQAVIERDLADARLVAAECSRLLVTESMHHEQALKMRLLDISHRLNAVANPDWVKT